MEGSKSSATLGKRIMKISIVSKDTISSGNVLLRNLLKFLPWEIAHFGVHWLHYYDLNNIKPPLWLWFVLIIPQVVVFIYFLSIFLCKGESSIYDHLSNTRINQVK